MKSCSKPQFRTHLLIETFLGFCKGKVLCKSKFVLRCEWRRIFLETEAFVDCSYFSFLGLNAILHIFYGQEKVELNRSKLKLVAVLDQLIKQGKLSYQRLKLIPGSRWPTLMHTPSIFYVKFFVEFFLHAFFVTFKYKKANSHKKNLT